MNVPEPQREQIPCPKCGAAAWFVVPYRMLFLAEPEIASLEEAMKWYPHRLHLEKRSDRQILWYFPDIYSGPREGWELRYGVRVCPTCGIPKKHDYVEDAA
jgi:hypothetical protein